MTYTDYNELHEKTLRVITNLEERKAQAIERDCFAVLFSDFESDAFGKNVYQYSGFDSYTPTLSVTVDSGDAAKKVLKWFRDKGWRTQRFYDWGLTTSSPFREYTLENRENEESPKIEVRVYFGKDAKCEFISEPTGDFEDVAEIIGVAAHRQQVMKKVLKCGDGALPVS